MSKSKHSQAILSFIAGLGAGIPATTSLIAEHLELSASRTRELLAVELKAGNVTREHIDEDGCKVLAYKVASGKAPEASDESQAPAKAEDLVAPKAGKKTAGKPAAKAKKAKTPKGERKPRRKASGIGKPNAKKVVNPQQTLDLKKALVERNGGKMVWANRVWVITVKGKSETMKSRDLAGLTLEALAKQFGLTV